MSLLESYVLRHQIGGKFPRFVWKRNPILWPLQVSVTRKPQGGCLKVAFMLTVRPSVHRVVNDLRLDWASYFRPLMEVENVLRSVNGLYIVGRYTHDDELTSQQLTRILTAWSVKFTSSSFAEVPIVNAHQVVPTEGST